MWQAQYSPFGKATVLVDDVVFKLRLPGQYEDSETGTHYNYLRDYDPQTGRYLTRDPISIGGGLNTYLYANADPLNSVDVLGLMPSSSLSAQGTIINVLEYDELHGYASDRNEVAYFNLLFRLTQEPLFQDLADGYSLLNEGGISNLSTSMYFLGESYLDHGVSNIRGIGCLVDGGPLDGTPSYLIEEIGLYSNLVFSASGVEQAFEGWAMEGGQMLVSLGAEFGTFVLDATFGLYGDWVRDNFGEIYIPPWFPRYSDAVGTLESGLANAVLIASQPELIWEGLTEDPVRLWAEQRYAEAVTGVALDFGTAFIGVGATAAAKVIRIKELLIAARRGDYRTPGDFDAGVDQIIDRYGDDPELVRDAAREAGLLDEVDARLAVREFDVEPHQQAVRDARALLPSASRRGGTVATAEIDISGVPDRLTGHSRIQNPSSELQAQGLVGQGSSNFDWNTSITRAGIPTFGNTHAEYRILDNIADRLGSNTEASGRIDLFIELPPCNESCGGPGGVIQQFRDRYPNIEVNVRHNNGDRLIP